MGVGKNIKQLRELRNFTQQYMAEHLNMSVGGYSKIESDQTDITLSRIEQIAEVLETELSTILNFDAKNIFNQCNNNNSFVTGTVQTQNNNENILDYLNDIQAQVASLKKEIFKKG